MHDVIALIPARLQSTRLPRKLLLPLGNATVIWHTYQSVQNSGLFKQVIVVCDHEDIYHEITGRGGEARISKGIHESGTDRIAEIAEQLDANYIVNVQGDEPFMKAKALQKLVDLLKKQDVQVASLMTPITETERWNDPSCVKVVTDDQGRALYFSRAPIPYHRDETTPLQAYQHIGVYAFKRDILLQFTRWPVSQLEAIEKLENLRLLEHHIPVHLALVDPIGISIDTEEDYQKAVSLIGQVSPQADQN